MRKLASFLAIIMAFFLVGCTSDSASEKSSATLKEAYKEGDKIELKSVTGTKITLLRKNGGFVIEGNENKILVVDMFGTFCPPCQEEAPSLMDFQLQNADDVFLLGLTHLEDVSDAYVVENFAAKYNAYYFISNAPQNKKIIETIVQDIAYKTAVSLPLKVVLKDGKYQKVTDIYGKNPENKFYIGKVGLDVIQKDIDALK